MALFTSILGGLLAVVAKVAVTAVASFALSTVAQALTKRPKAQTQSLDFEQTVQRRLRTGQPLEILVGKRIVAGVGFYDNAYSENNEQGVSVSVLSAKPCTKFNTLFLDGEPVELSGDPTLGEVDVTSHFLGINDAPRVRVRIFLGNNNNGLGSYLNTKFPSDYTSADRHGDYCVVVVDARNTNDDLDEETGTNHIPFQGYPEYKLEMTGAKICDPRNGGVYGDESTYVYTDNAGLIDAQYDFGWYSGVGDGRALIVGNGYPVGIMDFDQIARNADYCDAEEFGCSGLIRSAQSGDQEEIWKCYNAERVEHAASVFSVPEGDREFIGVIDMAKYPAAYVSAYDVDGYSTEVYNEVKTVYSEPLEFYAEKDLPPYSRPEWIAADNHIPRQLDLPLLFVTNMVQAAKLEKQEICISRTPSTCSIADLPFNFISKRVGRLITFINADVPAINNRVWIIKGRNDTSRGDVSFTLREYAGVPAFSFDESETPDVDVNEPTPRPWSEFWNPTEYIPAGVIENIDDTMSNVSNILDGTAEITDVNLAGIGSLNSANEARDLNISDASNAAASATGNTMTVSVNHTQVSGSSSASIGGISTSPVTVSQSGGTGAISYLWERVSGSTMTAESPNSASTSFVGNPSSAGQSASATFKCTITDSSSPPQTRTITVGASVVRSEGDGGDDPIN